MARDGTAEPVLRDQILMKNIKYSLSCSAGAGLVTLPLDYREESREESRE